jgi:uncharacterized protein
VPFQVIPRELAFFDLFEQAADNLVEGAREMSALTSALGRGETDLRPFASRIDELEEIGDELNHRTIALLNTTFVVPFDRDDIYDLASTTDDILDSLKAVADSVVLFGISEPLTEFRLQADVILRSSEAIARGMRAIRAPVGMEKVWVELVRLEREGDRVYHRGIASLYSGDFRAIDVLKWKDILSEMERGIDRCEDVANALESIALVYG